MYMDIGIEYDLIANDRDAKIFAPSHNLCSEKFWIINFESYKVMVDLYSY